MSEDTQPLRGIAWREVFPFTHIFRSFRVAIHPSKLVLALLALLCVYVGGRFLDGLWTARSRGIPNEVYTYQETLGSAIVGGNAVEPLTGRDLAAQLAERGKPGGDFGAYRWHQRVALEKEYADQLVRHKIQVDGKDITQDQANAAAATGKYLGAVKEQIKKARDEQLKQLDDQAKKVEEQHNKKELKDDEYEAARKQYLADRREVYTRSEESWREARQIDGRGLWDLFMDYEIDQVNGVVAGVTANNWFGGLTTRTATSAVGSPSVFGSIYCFFCVGPRWAFGQHAFYFILLGILFLIVWAIFGGAIARIAAVHVARDEKLSMRAALAFSSGKFLSFLFAPVIPLAIIIALGIVVAIGGLLLNIPQIGPILVGLFFFLALAAGAVMTLVAVGTLGGLNLMYPTVAVEGSDSFDAISRSFSYVYAKPWRMLWYTVVAIAYGALTFLFVRLFIFLTLKFTQAFVGAWCFTHADDGQYTWAAMYPGSSYFHLPYDLNSLSLGFGERLGAFFVTVWVYLLITLLGAYLVSFYFSSSTIVYYLMRREVDATELDDVYVEQSDDDFAEPLTAAPGTTAVAVATSEKVVIATPGSSMPSAPATEGTPPPT